MRITVLPCVTRVQSPLHYFYANSQSNAGLSRLSTVSSRFAIIDPLCRGCRRDFRSLRSVGFAIWRRQRDLNPHDQRERLMSWPIRRWRRVSRPVGRLGKEDMKKWNLVSFLWALDLLPQLSLYRNNRNKGNNRNTILKFCNIFA